MADSAPPPPGSPPAPEPSRPPTCPVVLAFVGIGVFFVWIITFFAVIITGRYPRGLRDSVVGVSRWAYRVTDYVLFMTDEYPPFRLS